MKRFVTESKIGIALVLLVAARCVDRVLYTRLTFEFSHYLWYLSNAILPIGFLISSWPVVWYKMLFTDDITPEMRQFPHYKFALMALLDTMFNFMSAFPTPHIGGNMANVLNQATLPFNMGLSMLFLGTKYKRCHILGAILVLYGALVDMIPVLQGVKGGNSPDATPAWITLYILSLVPCAGSNVYKEIGLKDVDLDIWYTNAWCSVYQLFWGATTLWTVQIKAFCDPPISFKDLIPYVAQAQECFMGNKVQIEGEIVDCNSEILVVFGFFLLFNMTYNQLMLYIFKEGSSVLFVVSSAVCLPLTDLLYMVPFLAGKKAQQSFTIFDGFSLFVLMMGLLVYHSEKESRTKGSKTTEKSPMFASPRLQRTHLMKRRRGKVVYKQSPMFPQSPKIGRKLTGNSPRTSLIRNPDSRTKYGTSNEAAV